MRYFEFIEGGIRKHFVWGYTEVFMSNPEDCFAPDEVDEVILKLSSLPSDAITQKEKDLLASLKEKRKKEKA